MPYRSGHFRSWFDKLTTNGIGWNFPHFFLPSIGEISRLFIGRINSTDPSEHGTKQSMVLMPTMPINRPLATRIAIVLICALSLGPLLTSFEVGFRFLPEGFPAIQRFHQLNAVFQWAWVFCGLLGAVSVISLRRNPILGLLPSLFFVAAYLPCAFVAWGHITGGCWGVLVALVLAIAGAAHSCRASHSSNDAPGISDIE